MTDVCPDCRRPRALSGVVWEALSIFDREKVCAAMFEIPGQEDEALIPCLIAERDLLRSELASAQAESLDFSHVINGAVDTCRELRAELEEAKALAFPPTHDERGHEDSDDVCDVCSHSAEAGKHTYRDCVANFESVNAQVNGYLSDENERLAAELASATRLAKAYSDKADRYSQQLAAVRKFVPSERDARICRNCEEPHHEHYSGPFAEPGTVYCSKYSVPRAAVSGELPTTESDLASALSGGGGHVFEGGTPEAMRDARLRKEIFDCVEQHPTKPKIATWHYAKALQLISDYRAEIASARAQVELSEAERRYLDALYAAVDDCKRYDGLMTLPFESIRTFRAAQDALLRAREVVSPIPEGTGS